MSVIPKEWKENHPLMTEQGRRLLSSILQHQNAPKWNYQVGDRITQEDLEAVENHRLFLAEAAPEIGRRPSALLQDWILKQKDSVWLFEESIPKGLSIERDWELIPTSSRADLAQRLVDCIPHNAPLDRAILYDTSGTTGHALELFHHPLAVAKNQAFADELMRITNRKINFAPDMMACINVCAQQHTFVFANLFSIWQQAGFAKINLNPKDWAGGLESAHSFCKSWDPQLITSDPISIAEMLSQRLPVRPKMILSTALHLDPELHQTASAHFGCPVINIYSCTETGPIACSLPGESSDLLYCLNPDLFVEVVDEEGLPLPDGELGEITVTGGRNPFLPLLRYRCGDFGRLSHRSLSDGRTLRCIEGLQGRKPVSFYATNGSLVSTVDISRSLRESSVFVQHSLEQNSDGSCLLHIRPAKNLPVNVEDMKRRLAQLFGEDAQIEITIDEQLGSQAKVSPWISHQS